MAPNLITLLGTMSIFIAQFLLIYHTGINGTEPGPNWIFLAAGFRYLSFLAVHRKTVCNIQYVDLYKIFPKKIVLIVIFYTGNNFKVSHEILIKKRTLFKKHFQINFFSNLTQIY